MNEVSAEELAELSSTTELRERDGVAALMDSQADAGDEGVDSSLYTLDALEAAELNVDLDPRPDEPTLS